MKQQYIIILYLSFLIGCFSLVEAQENPKSHKSNLQLTNKIVVDTNHHVINTKVPNENTLIQKSSFSKTNYLYIGAISMIISFFISFLMISILWFIFLREKILNIVRINIEGKGIIRPGRLNTAISNLVNNLQTFEYHNNANIYNTDEIVSQVIEKLKKEQNYQNMVNNQIQTTNQNNIPKIEPFPIVDPIIIPAQTKYFYSIEPRSDGSFFFVDKTTNEFEETESVFYFEKHGEFNAQFRVIDDIPTMKRAISYKAELLDTACDSLNGSQNTQKIITEKPGTVKKDGDKWVISTKAKIKFL